MKKTKNGNRVWSQVTGRVDLIFNRTWMTSSNIGLHAKNQFNPLSCLDTLRWLTDRLNERCLYCQSRSTCCLGRDDLSPVDESNESVRRRFNPSLTRPHTCRRITLRLKPVSHWTHIPSAAGKLRIYQDVISLIFKLLSTV